MTNPQANTLVLKDQAGSYYLVSQETLERGRVPAEHTAEMEQILAAAQRDAGEADVAGFSYLIAGYFALYTAGMGIGIGLYNWWTTEEAVAPDFTISSRESLPRAGGGRFNP